jgi:hypothetical protein
MINKDVLVMISLFFLVIAQLTEFSSNVGHEQMDHQQHLTEYVSVPMILGEKILPISGTPYGQFNIK